MTLRDQDITVVRGDRRDVVVTVHDETNGEPRDLTGFDASWIVRRGDHDPPIVALTSEDDDRLEVVGSDGRVTLNLDRELTDLPVPRARHDVVIRDGSGGAWTVSQGTLTLTR